MCVAGRYSRRISAFASSKRRRGAYVGHTADSKATAVILRRSRGALSSRLRAYAGPQSALAILVGRKPVRLPTAVGFALSASAALALTGCSGGGSQMAPASLGQAPDAGTQSVQRQAVQNGSINTSVVGANNSIVSGGRRITTPSFMDLSAVSQPLIFDSDPSGGAPTL